MTITREQVADLRPGDVVELSADDWEGAVIRGPLVEWYGALVLGVAGRSMRENDKRFHIRDRYGNPSYLAGPRHLTVISRAPRPLYVNHDREKPVPGDIVRDCDGDAWRFERNEWWCASVDAREDDDPEGFPIMEFRPLTLLWDGETGQVVP